MQRSCCSIGKIVVCIVGHGKPDVAKIVDAILGSLEPPCVDVLPDVISCGIQPIESLPPVTKSRKAWPRDMGIRIPRDNIVRPVPKRYRTR